METDGDAATTSGRNAPPDDALDQPAPGGGNVLLQLLEVKTKLVEVVQELHIRRGADSRLQADVSRLLLERQELEWEKEAAARRIDALAKRHSESLDGVKKQFQDKLRSSEDEKVKLRLTADLQQKDIGSLKEELKSLQLLRFGLEKRCSDLEQKLALQSSTRENQLDQLGQVEKRFSVLCRQCAAIKQAHQKLLHNVEEAVRINKRLSSTSDRQRAAILSLKKELDDVGRQLVAAKMNSVRHDKTDGLTGGEQQLQQLRLQLSRETETNKKLREENAAERAEKKEVMRALQHTQQLLLSQTQAARRSDLELDSQRETFQERRAAAARRSEAAEEKLVLLLERLAASQSKWDREKEELLDRIRSAEDAYEELRLKHAALQPRQVASPGGGRVEESVGATAASDNGPTPRRPDSDNTASCGGGGVASADTEPGGDTQEEEKPGGGGGDGGMRRRADGTEAGDRGDLAATKTDWRQTLQVVDAAAAAVTRPPDASVSRLETLHDVFSSKREGGGGGGGGGNDICRVTPELQSLRHEEQHGRQSTAQLDWCSRKTLETSPPPAAEASPPPAAEASPPPAPEAAPPPAAEASPPPAPEAAPPPVPLPAPPQSTSSIQAEAEMREDSPAAQEKLHPPETGCQGRVTEAAAQSKMEADPEATEDGETAAEQQPDGGWSLSSRRSYTSLVHWSFSTGPDVSTCHLLSLASSSAETNLATSSGFLAPPPAQAPPPPSTFPYSKDLVAAAPEPLGAAGSAAPCLRWGQAEQEAEPEPSTRASPGPSPSSASSRLQSVSQRRRAAGGFSCSQDRRDQGSSLRAQISRIEQLLSSERLRPPKRPRSDDDE